MNNLRHQSNMLRMAIQLSKTNKLDVKMEACINRMLLSKPQQYGTNLIKEWYNR